MNLPLPDVHEVLGPDSLGDEPRVTPRAGETPASPESAPRTSPADGPRWTGGTPRAGDLDSDGNPYDPDRHEAKPNAKGRWRGKRGNGARKVRGDALAGATSGKSPRPTPAPKAPEAPQAEAAPEAESDEVPESLWLPPEAKTPQGTPGQIDVVDAVLLGESDYAETGKTLFHGLFGALQMAFGDVWEPTPDEAKTYPGTFSRVWAHYQWPRLSPIVELGMKLGHSVAKRLKDETFSDRLKAMWTWAMGRKKKPQPEGDPETREVAET